MKTSVICKGIPLSSISKKENYHHHLKMREEEKKEEQQEEPFSNLIVEVLKEKIFDFLLAPIFVLPKFRNRPVESYLAALKPNTRDFRIIA